MEDLEDRASANKQQECNLEESTVSDDSSDDDYVPSLKQRIHATGVAQACAPPSQNNKNPTSSKRQGEDVSESDGYNKFQEE
jgi:hypothetical protein